MSENPVLESLRQEILVEKFNVNLEDFIEPNVVEPLLSLSMSMNIGYGAPRQRLHRDDDIHAVKHTGEWKFGRESQFGCLIAGCEVKRENGATMFVKGSHRWDDHRVPSPSEVTFAGMYLSSSL